MYRSDHQIRKKGAQELYNLQTLIEAIGRPPVLFRTVHFESRSVSGTIHSNQIEIKLFR